MALTRLSPRGRRSALPILLLTVLALLVVLGTLLVTGRDYGTPAEFELQLDTPLITVTAGDSISTTLTVRAHGSFRGPVTLATSDLPAGLVATFDPPSVTVDEQHPTATATLRLRTTGHLPAGPVNVGVTATAGGISQVSLVQLQIQPDGSLSSAPATAPAGTSTAFHLSGGPAGSLAPGVTLPVAVTLDNPGAQPVTVSSLTVRITGTSIRGCSVGNFALTQYTGRYPLTLPAHSHSTLATLGIGSTKWPQLAMLNLPINQDACKGVTVQLRFAGTGTGT